MAASPSIASRKICLEETVLQSVSSVVTYFLPSCSLLRDTTGYIAPSRGGDLPHLGRWRYKSRKLPVLPAAMHAQSASPDAEAVL